MVDGTGALQRPLGRRLVVEEEPAALVAARLPLALLGRLELERFEQGAVGVGGGRVGAHRVEALQRQLGRDLGVVGDQRWVGDVDDEQLVDQALGVGEADRGEPAPRSAVMPLSASRLTQKSSASSEATRQTIRLTSPAPARPSARPGTRRR